MDIIKFILGRGVKYLIETRGKNGALCCSIENSDVKIIEMPAININVNNQVGLGDVFGAVFFYSYIKNNSLHIALNDGVTASGYAASYNNINDFKYLKNDVLSRHN